MRRLLRTGASTDTPAGDGDTGQGITLQGRHTAGAAACVPITTAAYSATRRRGDEAL